MTFAYDSVHVSHVTISDPTGDNYYPVMKVPNRNTKIEILEAWAVSDTGITLGNGTGIALTLLDYGTAGAGNIGTVSSVLGGTTVTWTATTPKAFTLSDGTLGAGKWLYVKYDETGTVAPLNLDIEIHWVVGVGA